MSSTFPTTLDALTDPTATSKLNSPSHSQQHIVINDAVEKIEAKVGVDSSAVTTSHDYKLSGVATADKAASLTGTETLTGKTLTTPVVASIYQDAGKTKLMTVPAVASDTFALLGAEQTLALKTLTTPVIASFYQDAGKTKLMTVPNTASDTLVTLTATQTLSGKTLTKPIVNGSVQALTTDSDGTTVTFDMAASNIHTVVLGGNRTLAVSNVTVGQAFVLRLTQDATGSRTVTWFSTLKWAGGSAPTLTTTANKTDSFGFICTSTGNYDAYIIGQNL